MIINITALTNCALHASWNSNEFYLDLGYQKRCTMTHRKDQKGATKPVCNDGGNAPRLVFTGPPLMARTSLRVQPSVMLKHNHNKTQSGQKLVILPHINCKRPLRSLCSPNNKTSVFLLMPFHFSYFLCMTCFYARHVEGYQTPCRDFSE